MGEFSWSGYTGQSGLTCDPQILPNPIMVWMTDSVSLSCSKMLIICMPFYDVIQYWNCYQKTIDTCLYKQINVRHYFHLDVHCHMLIKSWTGGQMSVSNSFKIGSASEIKILTASCRYAEFAAALHLYSLRQSVFCKPLCRMWNFLSAAFVSNYKTA